MNAQGEERAAGAGKATSPWLAIGERLDTEAVQALDPAGATDSPPQLPHRRIPAQTVANVDRHPGGGQERLELRELPLVNEQRLLDEYRFAGTHRQQAAAGVEVIGHRNGERIHLRQHAFQARVDGYVEHEIASSGHDPRQPRARALEVPRVVAGNFSPADNPHCERHRETFSPIGRQSASPSEVRLPYHRRGSDVRRVRNTARKAVKCRASALRGESRAGEDTHGRTFRRDCGKRPIRNGVRSIDGGRPPTISAIT